MSNKVIVAKHTAVVGLITNHLCQWCQGNTRGLSSTIKLEPVKLERDGVIEEIPVLLPNEVWPEDIEGKVVYDGAGLSLHLLVRAAEVWQLRYTREPPNLSDFGWNSDHIASVRLAQAGAYMQRYEVVGSEELSDRRALQQLYEAALWFTRALGDEKGYFPSVGAPRTRDLIVAVRAAAKILGRDDKMFCDWNWEDRT